jgi:hypothetical protein
MGGDRSSGLTGWGSLSSKEDDAFVDLLPFSWRHVLDLKVFLHKNGKLSQTPKK